jgi:uncharacterized protein YbjT (DUF2867 family)
MADDAIVVLGGTGRQGGAVARELLRRGHPVRAVVRDPAKARPLAAAGAELVRGDLDDPASPGAYGVFSVQTFTGPDGLAGEVRQGRAVADAAARAGIRHLVYSSVAGAERDSGIPHFESKYEVERHIAELGLPATILRPVFFLDNFAEMGPQPADGGGQVLTLALPPDVPLQMIASRDIGAFAADAFEQPETYLGSAVEIAGDELTPTRIAEVFTEVTGEPTTFRAQPVEELRAYSAEMATMFAWFAAAGFRADLPALRRLRPDLTTLADWLRTRTS